MNTVKYNFAYENSHLPSTKEYGIIQKLSNRLLYQTKLVNECLVVGLFQYEDIKNYYVACELCEACSEGREYQCENEQAQDVYYWIAFDDDSDWTKTRLDKAGIPYIDNDFGFWIGRTDCGSGQEIYFLPELANALYNYETDANSDLVQD